MRSLYRALKGGALAASLMIASLAGAAPAWAQTPAEFFKGKTVSLVVGFQAGGGFDAYARLLAPHLAKRLQATVIVENVLGGGGQKATNQVYRAKPDGLTQYLMHGVPTVLSQLVDKTGASYDVSKFTWLGRVNAEPWVVLMGNNSPYKTVEQLKNAKQPVTLAALARADGPADAAASLCLALSIPCKIVLGFQGTNEASLAVIRGEVDGIVITDTSALNYSKGNQAHPLTILSTRASRHFPNLKPLIEEVKLTEEQRWWIDFRAAIGDVGRSLVAPPNMKPDMEEFLTNVWREVLTDPEVIAAGEKIQMEFDYLAPSESKKLVANIFGSKPEKIEEVRDAYLNRFF